MQVVKEFICCIMYLVGGHLRGLSVSQAFVGSTAQITRRESDHLRIGGSEAEKEQLRMEAQRVGKQISALLWRIPRELLLLLKTNDCLRSVDHALGQVCATRQHCSASGLLSSAQHVGSWATRSLRIQICAMKSCHGWMSSHIIIIALLFFYTILQRWPLRACCGGGLLLAP